MEATCVNRVRQSEFERSGAIVIIGRNEGPRLVQCLQSLGQIAAPVIYVDSGSTDGSADLARKWGAEVIALNQGPYSAARSRNAGFQYAAHTQMAPRFIQFLDGDCELDPRWLESACTALDAGPDTALVFGSLRERHPGRSIYNLFCDLEWRGDPGETESSGGIFMARAAAFQAAGGFNSYIIAGEEPDLCYRLRQAGWKILRIDAEMGTHDAGIHHFSQWWRRCLRSGHAYAEAATLYKKNEGYWRRETRSVCFWGMFLPAAIIAGAAFNIFAAILAAAYPVLAARIYHTARRRAFTRKESILYSALCTLAKFPQACGILYFHILRLRGKRTSIIEYK
jgi:GT2 family glycosyltransferase